MSFIHRHAKVFAVALACLALGAGGSAIASAGAATSAPSASAGALGRVGLLKRIRWATVHASLVTYTKKQGFVTVTIDRGFVQSVSGNSLTMREGVKNETYKTLTLSLPAATIVRNNRTRSTLSSLTSGEHVLVVQGPQRTLVVARSTSAG